MRRKRDFSVDFGVLGTGGGQISGTLSGGTSSGCFCVPAPAGSGFIEGDTCDCAMGKLAWER